MVTYLHKVLLPDVDPFPLTPILSPTQEKEKIRQPGPNRRHLGR